MSDSKRLIKLLNYINALSDKTYYIADGTFKKNDATKIYYYQDGKKMIIAWVDQDGNVLLPSREYPIAHIDNSFETFINEDGTIIKPEYRRRVKQTARQTFSKLPRHKPRVPPSKSLPHQSSEEEDNSDTTSIDSESSSPTRYAKKTDYNDSSEEQIPLSPKATFKDFEDELSNEDIDVELFISSIKHTHDVCQQVAKKYRCLKQKNVNGVIILYHRELSGSKRIVVAKIIDRLVFVGSEIGRIGTVDQIDILVPMILSTT